MKLEPDVSQFHLTVIIKTVVSIIFIILASSLQAQTYFFANFEDPGIPNGEVNDINLWNKKVIPQKVTWKIDNENKRLELPPRGNCNMSSITPLPDPLGHLKELTDYTIIADIVFKHMEDLNSNIVGWGLAVRYNDQGQFYAMIVGLSDQGINLYICGGPTAKGECFHCPTKAKAKAIRFKLDEKEEIKTYTFRFTVRDNNLKAEFGLKGIGKPDQPNAINKKEKVIFETKANQIVIEKGKPAILNFTQQAGFGGFVDNIRVFGPQGLSVAQEQNLAITWAKIRTYF